MMLCNTLAPKSAAMEAQHVVAFVLLAIARKVTMSPVDNSLIITDRIGQPQVLCRMGDEFDCCIRVKPARIEGVISRTRIASHVPTQK